jgi:hypothetical protein
MGETRTIVDSPASLVTAKQRIDMQIFATTAAKAPWPATREHRTAPAKLKTSTLVFRIFRPTWFTGEDVLFLIPLHCHVSCDVRHNLSLADLV